MKKYFALILVLLMAVGAMPVFANPLTEEVITIQNGLRVIADGEELHPKGYVGEDLPMFTYNGNTYLPLRSIANAFDKPIAWDGENNIVYLGQRPSGDTFMTLKRYYESGDHSGDQWRLKWYDEHMGADGEMKQNVLYAKPKDIDSISDSDITQTEVGPTMYTIQQCGGEVVLDGQFNRFTAQLFVPEEALKHPFYDYNNVDFTTNAEEARFQVTAYYMAGTVDSEDICDKKIHVGEAPIDIDLDMTNVKYISFHLHEGQSHDGLAAQGMLANPTFWREETPKKK